MPFEHLSGAHIEQLMQRHAVMARIIAELAPFPDHFDVMDLSPDTQRWLQALKSEQEAR